VEGDEGDRARWMFLAFLFVVAALLLGAAFAFVLDWITNR